MSRNTIMRRGIYQVRDPALEDHVFNDSNLGLANFNKVHLALRRMKGKCHQVSSIYKGKGLVAPYKSNATQEMWIETLIDEFNNKNKIITQKHINIMCKYNKYIGTITNYINRMYIIAVDNKTIYVPFEVMHKFPVFPLTMLENGHLKVGEKITMVKKDEKTFYPDHETYGIKAQQEQKQTVDGSYLLKSAKPYKKEQSLQELTAKLSELIATLPVETRMETFKILTAADMTEEEKTEKLTSLVEFPLDFEESQTLEKKSLFFSPKNQKDDKAQLKEIVESIVAMCNCEEQKHCQLVVGVNDKTNRTCKLQNDIATNYPQMETLDQFQNTFLVPFIKSYTYDNPMLMSSLKYNWYSYNGDLILIIDINYHGDPIICKGGRLPYRCDSAKMVAEGMDLVNMVKKLTRAKEG